MPVSHKWCVIISSNDRRIFHKLAMTFITQEMKCAYSRESNPSPCLPGSQLRLQPRHNLLGFLSVWFSCFLICFLIDLKKCSFHLLTFSMNVHNTMHRHGNHVIPPYLKLIVQAILNWLALQNANTDLTGQIIAIIPLGKKYIASTCPRHMVMRQWRTIVTSNAWNQTSETSDEASDHNVESSQR